jgi:hypothetical protein
MEQEAALFIELLGFRGVRECEFREIGDGVDWHFEPEERTRWTRPRDH